MMATNAPKGGIYQLFMLLLCVYVLLAMLVDAVFTLNESTSQILQYADTIICVIFLADFFFSVLAAPRKLAYLKWGWIDFVSSIPMVDFLRWGRLARIARILRLLRGIRSTKMLVSYVLKRRARGTFAAVSLVSLILLVFGSIAILQCEKTPEGNIHTAEDALWWSLTTITTVGYGDKYPVTTEGHIVAAILMIAGVALFGTFTAFVASWFLEPGKKEQESEFAAVRQEIAGIRKVLEADRP